MDHLAVLQFEMQVILVNATKWNADHSTMMSKQEHVTLGNAGHTHPVQLALKQG